MRRIYESDALHRDDDEPGAPVERERDTKPRAMRSINAGAWTRRLVPTWFRHRAISLSIRVPKTEFEAGERVPFEVTMKNAMPFPVTLATRSPVLWTWSVDGFEEASKVSVRDPPDHRAGFEFDRGERKRFRKHWDGMFRVSESEWEPVDPGEYTLGAAINVEDPEGSGLADELTVTILP